MYRLVGWPVRDTLAIRPVCATVSCDEDGEVEIYINDVNSMPIVLKTLQTFNPKVEELSILYIVSFPGFYSKRIRTYVGICFILSATSSS